MGMDVNRKSFSDLAHPSADLLWGTCQSVLLQQVKAGLEKTPAKQVLKWGEDKKGGKEAYGKEPCL